MTSQKTIRRLGFLILPIVLLVAAGGWFLFDPGFRWAEQSTVSTSRPTDDAFEQRVRDYLMENPEIIVDAMQNLEQRTQAAQQSEAQLALAAYNDELLHSTDSPVGGNPLGDVTMVEFFDYNCPYCRQVAPAMIDAESGDPNLKIVYKEFPILGPNSVFVAKAALAAARQDLYPEFHKAMMLISEPADESQVEIVAEQIGLDMQQLRTDMQDPAIEGEIQRNFGLAQALRINGTPGFVIGQEILRGATDLQTMQTLIANARNPAER